MSKSTRTRSTTRSGKAAVPSSDGGSVSNGKSAAKPSNPRSKFPDLTERAPRSPRVRLGGFALLPRILDKGRATIIKKNGEYNYNCPLDQHFFRFAGVDAQALLKQLSLGKGDGEILHWVHANSQNNLRQWQIIQWSLYHDTRVPTDVESREFFNDYHARVAKNREDIGSWFDMLDLDDFASFGGLP